METTTAQAVPLFCTHSDGRPGKACRIARECTLTNCQDCGGEHRFLACSCCNGAPSGDDTGFARFFDAEHDIDHTNDTFTRIGMAISEAFDDDAAKVSDTGPSVEKLARELTQHGKSGVVCTRCASTLVDQRSIRELACASCGQTAPWNADLFVIVRDGSELSDFRTSLSKAAYRRQHRQADA